MKMKNSKSTPTQRDNETILAAGWQILGNGNYLSPNTGGLFNRRVALAMARMDEQVKMLLNALKRK